MKVTNTNPVTGVKNHTAHPVHNHTANKQSNLQPGISTIASNSSGPSLPIQILSKGFGLVKACFSFVVGLFVSRQSVTKPVLSTPPQAEPLPPLVTDPQTKTKIVQSYKNGLDADGLVIQYNGLSKATAEAIVDRLDKGLDI